MVVSVVLDCLCSFDPSTGIDAEAPGALSVGKGLQIETRGLAGLSGIVSIFVVGGIVADAGHDAPPGVHVCVVVNACV